MVRWRAVDIFSTGIHRVELALPLVSCSIHIATGLLPNIDPPGCWNAIVLFLIVLIVLCLLFFSFFFDRRTLNFCLNALWSEEAALSAYEVRDVCCSWSTGGFCRAGKTQHLYHNIHRMHTKNFTRNVRHNWILKEEKGIRSMKRIDQQLDSIFVLEKGFGIKGWDVGGSVRCLVDSRDWKSLKSLFCHSYVF